MTRPRLFSLQFVPNNIKNNTHRSLSLPVLSGVNFCLSETFLTLQMMKPISKN